MFKIIENSDRIYKAQIDLKFVTTCGVTGKPFQGKISIIFKPNALYPEYCSLEEWIDTFKTKSLNHETVARLVHDVTRSLLACPVKVIVLAESVIHPPALAIVADTEEERNL